MNKCSVSRLSLPGASARAVWLRMWPGHPLEHEVLESLAAFRRKQSDLRRRVDQHNARVARPSEYLRVVSYAGQHVIAEEERGTKP